MVGLTYLLIFLIVPVPSICTELVAKPFWFLWQEFLSTIFFPSPFSCLHSVKSVLMCVSSSILFPLIHMLNRHQIGFPQTSMLLFSLTSSFLLSQDLVQKTVSSIRLDWASSIRFNCPSLFLPTPIIYYPRALSVIMFHLKPLEINFKKDDIGLILVCHMLPVGHMLSCCWSLVSFFKYIKCYFVEHCSACL